MRRNGHLKITSCDTTRSREMAVWAMVEIALGKLRGELCALIAPVFAQARSRFAAFADVAALLAVTGDRKSCWQLVEAAGHARPRRMQALLAEYAWDSRMVLERLPPRWPGWSPPGGEGPALADGAARATATMSGRWWRPARCGTGCWSAARSATPPTWRSSTPTLPAWCPCPF
jgi:hypothetical protein